MAEALAVGAVVAGGTIATGGTATPALLAGAGSAILKNKPLNRYLNVWLKENQTLIKSMQKIY